MDPLAAKVAGRCAAAEEAEERSTADGVLFESDLLEVPAEERATWKGYRLTERHAEYTPELWEEGDTDKRRTDRHQFRTLDALVKHLGDQKFVGWLESMLEGKPKKDRKGTVTQLHCEVERQDGRPLSREEREFLSSRLKLR